MPRDVRLSREGIVAEAVALADADGLAAVSMRRLAQQLGVDPMSIYHHLPDKRALLAAMADAVVAAVPRPPEVGPWTDRMRELVLGARRTVLRHPWVARVVADLDEPTPAVLAHLDAVVGVVRDGGGSVALAHHALHVLGSRVLGFSQDLFDDGGATPDDVATAAMVRAWGGRLPHLAELALAAAHDGGLGGCDDDAEFAFALDLLLAGLERARRTES